MGECNGEMKCRICWRVVRGELPGSCTPARKLTAYPRQHLHKATLPYSTKKRGAALNPAAPLFTSSSITTNILIYHSVNSVITCSTYTNNYNLC